MRQILFFVLAIFGATRAAAQDGATTSTPGSLSDPDNKHVKVSRITVEPYGEMALPKLANESVVICLRGDSLKHVPEHGAAEIWNEGPGSAVWNRGGFAYWIENHGDMPAELLLVDLKDSNTIEQVSVPWTERDPLSQNPRLILRGLENEHVRLLRIRLGPREGTEESQFASRLEIALADAHISVVNSSGKSLERTQKAGEVVWRNYGQMISITNLAEQPADMLVVELKHPFCYQTSPDAQFPAGMDPISTQYLHSVWEGTRKKWQKNMQNVREPHKGYVMVEFKILEDGSISEDGMALRTVFADEWLIEKALSAIRGAGPFSPIPSTFTKKFVDFRFSFLTSLPPKPLGCSD